MAHFILGLRLWTTAKIMYVLSGVSDRCLLPLSSVVSPVARERLRTRRVPSPPSSRMDQLFLYCRFHPSRARSSLRDLAMNNEGGSEKLAGNQQPLPPFFSLATIIKCYYNYLNVWEEINKFIIRKDPLTICGRLLASSCVASWVQHFSLCRWGSSCMLCIEWMGSQRAGKEINIRC